MKRYANSRGGLIRSVDIVDRPETLDVYLRVRNQAALERVKQKTAELGFKVMAQTIVESQPMLVLSGPRCEAKLIEELTEIGGALPRKTDRKPFDAWKIRSMFGFSGQLLQLASSVMKNKVDAPLLMFSGTNLAANTINLVYRGQERDDPHQLKVVKKDINDLLTPLLPKDKPPIAIEDSRAQLREHVRDNVQHPFNNFMRRYSVNVGELGLRYVGAAGMAYPASGWRKAMTERRMPSLNTEAPLRAVAGIGSMIGKTVATTSTVPDPFNPKPRSRFDEFREQYSFLAGGIIEAGAFSVLTYDALVNSAPVMKNGVVDTSRSLKFGKTYHRDWLSAAGGALFVSGYIARSWAKYGERKIDMTEVYAHASDMLCMLPPEKIPQALADTAAQLANHFHHKRGLTFGDIYNKISDDLCREHHISILPPTRGDTSIPVPEKMPEGEAPETQVQADSIKRDAFKATAHHHKGM